MDISEIRRRRLGQLIREDFGGNQSLFSARTGIKAPQVNRWLSETATDKRTITEPSARKIEKKSGKPFRWLDGIEEIEGRMPLNPPCVDANLNKSTELLVGNTTTVAFSKDEQELVKGYRLASPREKRSMLHTAQIVIEDFSKRSEQKK